MSVNVGTKIRVPFFINATDLAAGTSQYVIAPEDGYIVEARGVVQEAIVTGGDITFELSDVAVAGLTLTFANSATVGTVVSDTPTKGSATRKVTKGQAIEVVSAAAFNGGGAVNGHIVIASNLEGEDAL